MPALQSQVQPRLYFAYGSNMWKEQMMLRCPNSKYKGVGRLTNYRWIINDRGYANVVSSRSHQSSEDEVYGLVYDLTSSDEDQLDRNEGVPTTYTKEMVAIDFWKSMDGKAVDVGLQGIKKHMLIYIDLERVADSKPQEEYIHRMNMGIKDAVDGAGLPFIYVQRVIRPFIPEQWKKGVEELARKQASDFAEAR